MNPLIVIDFEASCLGHFSYPIEAGIARWDGSGYPIKTWSSLITPEDRWVKHGEWTWEAQQVHGIAPIELNDGLAPPAVITGLLSIANSAQQVLCDGGEHDLRWLVRLTMAAGRNQLPFGLSDFDNMTMSFTPDVYRSMMEYLQQTPIPHRAGPDAVRMVQACVVGLTGSQADVQTISAV